MRSAALQREIDEHRIAPGAEALLFLFLPGFGCHVRPKAVLLASIV